MDVITKNQKIAQFFFALGHTRRLRIVSALASHGGGITFEALEAATNVRQSSLTHHLRILKEAGLVTRKVKGRYSYYRFDQRPLLRYFGAADLGALRVHAP